MLEVACFLVAIGYFFGLAYKLYRDGREAQCVIAIDDWLDLRDMITDRIRDNRLSLEDCVLLFPRCAAADRAYQQTSAWPLRTLLCRLLIAHIEMTRQQKMP